MPSLDMEIVRVGAMSYLGQLSPLEPRMLLTAPCAAFHSPTAQGASQFGTCDHVCEEWRERWAEPRMELYKTSECVVVDREDIKLILRIFFFACYTEAQLI